LSTNNVGVLATDADNRTSQTGRKKTIAYIYTHAHAHTHTHTHTPTLSSSAAKRM